MKFDTSDIEILKKGIRKHIDWDDLYAYILNTYCPNALECLICEQKIKQLVSKDYVIELLVNNKKYLDALNNSLLRAFKDLEIFHDFGDEIYGFIKPTIQNDPNFESIKFQIVDLYKKTKEKIKTKENKDKEKRKRKHLAELKKLGYSVSVKAIKN